MESIDVGTIEPIGRREASRLASDEYRRFIDLVASLSDSEWKTATECPGWDVRATAGHVLGGMEANASIRENVHQLLGSRKRPEPMVDAISALQIEERAELTGDQVVARLEKALQPAVKGRKRIPKPLRTLVRIPIEIPGIKEWWSAGYLLDTIYTRDTWMHRVDVSRALGVEMELTQKHDGRLIADIVAEWSRRHGKPFELELDGPAGAFFISGDGGEKLTLDAVEFCRILSGRAKGEGLLAQPAAF